VIILRHSAFRSRNQHPTNKLAASEKCILREPTSNQQKNDEMFAITEIIASLSHLAMNTALDVNNTHYFASDVYTSTLEPDVVPDEGYWCWDNQSSSFVHLDIAPPPAHSSSTCTTKSYIVPNLIFTPPITPLKPRYQRSNNKTSTVQTIPTHTPIGLGISGLTIKDGSPLFENDSDSVDLIGNKTSSAIGLGVIGLRKTDGEEFDGTGIVGFSPFLRSNNINTQLVTPPSGLGITTLSNKHNITSSTGGNINGVVGFFQLRDDEYERGSRSVSATLVEEVRQTFASSSPRTLFKDNAL
jgi:hypothetical protein